MLIISIKYLAQVQLRADIVLQDYIKVSK